MLSATVSIRIDRRMATKPLKILYVCSELAPLVSTGGLADVAAALPRALKRLGHDVRVCLPCYNILPDEVRGEHHCLCVADLGSKTQYGSLRVSKVPGTDIPLYLIDHEVYFGRGNPYGYGAYEYNDNAERFCFFCLAILHGIPQLHWRPDVVHCHDWHTAALPAFIKTRVAHTPAWRSMATLFTIHNLAYQGRYKSHLLPSTGFGWDLFTPDCLEFYGDFNLMKAGIAFASKINTVSPRYAKEIQTPEYGEGLDGLLKKREKSLTGILNGVDYTVWNPLTDKHIPAPYSFDDLSGKMVCKKALQSTLGLPQRDVPVFGMVSRLYWQKGIDLLVGAIDRIMQHDVQMVILGSGDPYFEQPLWQAAQRYPDKMRIVFRFDVALSHLIEAGSDFFVMPSRFEPCGLSQLYSLAYGTIPVVRETGGLADSVTDTTDSTLAKGTATGILFGPRTPEALAEGIERAVAVYNTPKVFHAVRINGMKQDFSWERSSKEYVKLYKKAVAMP